MVEDFHSSWTLLDEFFTEGAILQQLCHHQACSWETGQRRRQKGQQGLKNPARTCTRLHRLHCWQIPSVLLAETSVLGKIIPCLLVRTTGFRCSLGLTGLFEIKKVMGKPSCKEIRTNAQHRQQPIRPGKIFLTPAYISRGSISLPHPDMPCLFFWQPPGCHVASMRCQTSIGCM